MAHGLLAVAMRLENTPITNRTLGWAHASMGFLKESIITSRDTPSAPPFEDPHLGKQTGDMTSDTFLLPNTIPIATDTRRAW